MDKKIFKNPVRVFKQRQNGTKKEFNTKGGYIRNGAGIMEFWIKISRFKKVKMKELPDPDAIDEGRFSAGRPSPSVFTAARPVPGTPR